MEFFFPILKALVVVAALIPAAFVFARHEKFRRMASSVRIFVYMVAFLTATGLAVLWFLGVRP